MNKINNYFVILSHDIYFGIYKKKLYYIIEAIFLAFCAGFLIYSVNSCLGNGVETTQNVGFIDFWIDLLDGSLPYDKNSTKVFSIEPIWLMFNCFLAISVGFYAENDLSKNSIQIVLRMKSKLKWWIGKCVWCLLFVFIYYLMYNFIILIACLLNNSSLLFTNTVVCEKILEINTCGISNSELLYISVLVPLIISFSISILQMTLSLFVKPVYACLVILCYTVICVYYNNKFLLFNYSMVKRNVFFLPNDGVNPQFGITLAVALVIIAIVSGYFRLKQKDII